MIMIDIETLGLRPGAPIPTIGYCIFGWDGVKDHGTIAIDIERWPAAKPEIGTIKFWLRQSPEAIKSTFFRSEDSLLSWPQALMRLQQTVDFAQGSYGEGVWANGPLFDLAHLEYWYDQLSEKSPWTHRQPRDCRTLFETASDLTGWDQRVTTQHMRENIDASFVTMHDAESDAILQALVVIDAHDAIMSRDTRSRAPDDAHRTHA
jgi:hypothetical protein